MRHLKILWRRIGLALFAAGLILSPNVWAAGKLLALEGEGAIAEYRLRSIPPERYVAEIEAALDAGDGDLARSLAALAADQKVTVPNELAARVAALPAVDVGNVLGQGWNCVVNGDFDSEAGFACVVATDITGIGDVRDLVAQGGNYVTGRPVNYLTLGLAGVGLGITASTYVSLGASLPVRAGASFLKGMVRAGKLSPKLVREMSETVARGIDGPALKETMQLAGEFRFGEIGKPLARVFNPRSVARLEGLASDFTTIGKVGGVRAMKLSAEAADSSRDVKVLAKTAEKYQNRYLGVMKLLGKSAVRLADLLLTIGSWLIAAVLRLWGVLWFLLRGVSGGARFAARLLRRRHVAQVQAA